MFLIRTVGIVLLLLFLGITAALGTVAYLTYKRNGWLIRRPTSNFNYGRIPENSSVITVEG